ncbi:hypothetical protein CTAYLR_002980 [Chrysophaeum taylorii]|uniref:Histidine kinase/HSP90-like ATPase domain-containing protein n=1 Tax=Chrysophaeum taylorii TaxID=2483200 RepID=A0AAD7U4Y5_9STRA|nr:hypothetical protein CTAYLR_002980 [Chrysophaeum taylorii]
MPRIPRAGATVQEQEYEFSADVSRVMEIIINSLYSDKDVFLRELVSNAADACDKKRFLGLQQDIRDDLRIRVKPDKERRVLCIEDTGVGMSKDELVNNLGQIARSGTKKFQEALDSKDVNLIGQFGVGFYSGFLVAEKMVVVSKRDDKEHQWSSDAKTFEIKETTGEIESSSGTRIELSLKEDCDEYLEDWKLKDLLKRYSEFVNFPIDLWQSKTKFENNETVTSFEYETVNSKPLWLRRPKEVNASEYVDFYKSAFKAYDEPLAWTHFSLEGQVQFRAMLFVPSVLPFELSRNMFEESASSIKLYVKRVFINDKFSELIPRWLVFLKGLVDSEDLPLNVGREILQKSKMLSIIKKRIVRKSIDMFSDLNSTEFSKFWENYGKYLKVGVVEESGDTQQDLAKLCRFFSTKGETTLDEYVENLGENRTKILYVSGDSKAAASRSPVLEKLKKMDYEVLLLTEPLDELVVQAIGEYKKTYQLVDAAKENLSGVLDDADEEDDPDFDDLKEKLQQTLGKAVTKVQLSKRLESSPATLVQGAYGMSPMMRRYMAAQATTVSEQDYQMYGVSAPTLEINPTHPIVLKLKDQYDADTALLLYDVAALASGYDLTDASAFANRITNLMVGDASPPPPSSSEEEEEDDGDVKEVEVVQD